MMKTASRESTQSRAMYSVEERQIEDGDRSIDQKMSLGEHRADRYSSIDYGSFGHGQGR